MQFWDAMQDYFVVTPVCKRAPQAQAVNSENCPPATASAPHASLRLPQRTNHPNTHCSGKQANRPASAPIRPNTVSNMTWHPKLTPHLLLASHGLRCCESFGAQAHCDALADTATEMLLMPWWPLEHAMLCNARALACLQAGHKGPAQHVPAVCIKGNTRYGRHALEAAVLVFHAGRHCCDPHVHQEAAGGGTSGETQSFSAFPVAGCRLHLGRSMAEHLLICLLTDTLQPVQERIRSLVADVSTKENTIVDLQGRLMNASAADAPFTSQAPQAQPATPKTLLWQPQRLTPSLLRLPLWQ